MSKAHTAADAPSAKLRRVIRGDEVAVITLPTDHKILVDGRPGPDDRLLVCRINQHSAFCWLRTQRPQHIKGWLKDAKGEIETARSRVDCYGWPTKFQALSAGDLK